MKPKSLLPATISSLLLTASLTACLTPMDQAKRISFLGDPAAVSFSDRTVTIYPTTTYVNVTGGEIIKFISGNEAFAWNFDGAGEYHFDLAMVAPPGFLDQKVMVYVSPDPFVNGAK